MRQKQVSLQPPGSAANYAVNFCALFLFLGGVYALRFFSPRMPTFMLAGLSLLCMAVPLWLYDLCVLKVHTRPSTGLQYPCRPFNREHVTIKLIGLLGTFLVIVFLYRAIPFYAHPFYVPFFNLLGMVAPGALVLCGMYFCFLSGRQVDPYDGYWHMGCLLTGRWKDVNGVILREYALVWFIKAFFTPIMIGILVENINEIVSFSWQVPGRGFFSIYTLLLIVFYSIDVIYGIVGYVITVRVLDTHIRSVEPTLIGWLSCLACYAPFSLWGIDRLPYEDQIMWHHWFALQPLVFYFWGTVIIFLSLVYCLATVAFGYRMSNLTYRGIITAGPYRYTKHPAYMCKVLSWWMISLPFFALEGPWVAVMNTAALTAITAIYYLRARTEENHLSNYPEYVAYAEWIKAHGVFRSLTKQFPSWQYSLENAQRYNSVVWFKKMRKK